METQVDMVVNGWVMGARFGGCEWFSFVRLKMLRAFVEFAVMRGPGTVLGAFR